MIYPAESLLERAILSLAYGCGLSSIRNGTMLNMDDIKIKEGVLSVPRGKNNKRRVMPLSTGVIKDLDDYLNEVRICKNTKRVKVLYSIREVEEYKNTYNRILKMIIHRTANGRIKTKQSTIHNLRHCTSKSFIRRRNTDTTSETVLGT
ncbi:MAG: tyrosine-type recombinase/integrase [Saprospiraceae bacterium]|nr:tyrosine-type recombinase/integrase [Candidatus Vicinibacter affinis]